MSFSHPPQIDAYVESGYWYQVAAPHAAAAAALQSEVDGGDLGAEPTFTVTGALAGIHQLFLVINQEFLGATIFQSPLIAYQDEVGGETFENRTQGYIVGAGPSAPIYHGMDGGENCLLWSPGIDPAADPYAGLSSAFRVPSPPAVASGGDFTFPVSTKIYWGSIWEVYAVDPNYVPPPPPPPTPHEQNPCPPINPAWPYPDPELYLAPGPPGIVRRNQR